MSIPGHSVPHLGHGFRLQWEEVQGCYVLLYPEGMVKLNGSAGQILKRCDGQASVDAIVDELQLAFNNSNLRPELENFLDIALKQSWLVLR